MSTLFVLLILLLLSSQTYLCYIFFLLSTVLLSGFIFLLGNYYIGLIYLMIYVGSIAVLFIYILMVLSIISSYKLGGYWSLFILGTLILFFTLGTLSSICEINESILNIGIQLYDTLLIIIALILFLAMVFAIRYI